MGPDWNGDGRHDWRDDVFYQTEIQNNAPDESSTSRNNIHPNTDKSDKATKSVNGGIVFDMVSLLYLGLLLPGDIGVNWFTMLFGFVCVIRLGYSFLKWLYK